MQIPIKKSMLCLTVALLAVMIVSCSTVPVALTSSNTPLLNKTIGKNLGKTAGSDGTWSFLGLWMYDRPDIDEAIAEALGDKGGNALINVRCYRSFTYWVLFSWHSVKVEGEAVMLKDAEEPDAKKKK